MVGEAGGFVFKGALWLGGGADIWMADAEPPFEQRLRAEGAEQRDVHRGGHDPPDTEAAGEGSVNLTKQALTDDFYRYLQETGD